MTRDKEQITTNGQCPEIDRLEDYAKGRLSVEEAEAIRQHIEVCADCREIYEAFKEADCDFVTAAVDDINSRIDSRTAAIDGKENKGRIIKMAIKYAAAAVVAGLCIMYVSKYSDQAHNADTVADDIECQDVTGSGMHHRQSEQPATDVQSDINANKPSEEVKQPAEKPAAEPVAVVTNNDSKKPSDKTTPAADNSKQSKPVSGDKKQSGNSTKKENVTKTDDLQDEFEAGMVTRGVSITKPNSDKVVNVDKVEKLMVDAVRFYDEGNYTVAKAVLERIVDEDPNNNEALKKLGLCDYKLKNYGQSLKNLRRVAPKDEQERREIEGYIDDCLKHINY